MITAEQIRSGRKLLGWSDAMLAKRADCSVKTVWAVEGSGPLSDRAARMVPRLQRILEEAGVEFILEGEGAVRLRNGNGEGQSERG